MQNISTSWTALIPTQKIPEHFAKCRRFRKGRRSCCFHFRWLGSRYVQPAETDRQLHSAQRQGLHLLGRGVSQGHSDAIRRIKGVKDGKQYTVPVPAALEKVRAGENPELTTREKHTRECYVVAEEGADLARIENEIKTMPNYFADYDTTVHFISQEELDRDHSGIPHGGFVIRTGTTGADTKQMIEYSLKLGSNPEFTSSVIVAYARAAYKMAQEGITGAKTVFDVAPTYLSPLSAKNREKICFNLS